MYKRRKNFAELSKRQKRRLKSYALNCHSNEENQIELVSSCSGSSCNLNPPIIMQQVALERSDTENIYSDAGNLNSNQCDLSSNIPNNYNDIGVANVASLPTLEESLRSCFHKHNLSQSAISDILKVLKEHCFENLPSDARTLMKTTRNVDTEIAYVNGGQYYHLGVENGLINSIDKHFVICPSEIKLDFNVDGLPISKSSNAQFWPILAAIHADLYSTPFAIGIHYRNTKPSDSNIFLKPFVDEMKYLMKKGLTFRGKLVNIKINALICDAPARAFVCGTKNHTGYFGCPKCSTEGNFTDNRVVFPELTAKLRTDLTFRDNEQPEHHKYQSILQELDIDMISQIPLDPMHLVFLGVTKRLLQFWVQGKINVRINKINLEITESKQQKLKRYIPSEFARLPRRLAEIDRWKATEFRLFLLYTGQVIMKDVLPKSVYQHFLALSISIRILSDKNCLHLVDYAEQNLKYFVEKYSVLYGSQYMSYNVHCLIHLCDEVRKLGAVQNFSAFKFENYMYQIKQKLKTSGKPLHQIVKRLQESRNINETASLNKVYPQVIMSGATVKLVEFSSFMISFRKPNNCCLLRNGKIALIDNMWVKNNNVMMNYRTFSKHEDFFEVPCSSSVVGVFSVNLKDLSEVSDVDLVEEISTKCMILPYHDDNHIVMKLVHI